MSGYTLMSAAAAKSDANVDAAELADGLQDLPNEIGRLTRDLFAWLEHDMLNILVGCGVAVGLYTLFIFLRTIARRRYETAKYGSWRWVVLGVLSNTRSFFLAMVGIRVAVMLFGAPGTWTRFISILFTIAATIQGALWVQRFLLSLVERKATPESDPDGNISSALGVLQVLIAGVVWALAAIILLDNLGVNVTGLVAGLGIGGIAIGLAGQGIFSDLFAALSILFDQPFKRGDTIQVGGANGTTGTVEHIGLKTTRLRAVSGEVVILSNTNLLSQQINNLAAYDRRRVVMTLSVIYQTPVNQLLAIPLEVKKIVDARPRCTFDRAHFVNFAPSSLDFELVFLLDDAAMLPMYEERQAVGFAILQRFSDLGIDFAYPSQVSFLAGPDGRIVEPENANTAGVRPAPAQA